MTTATRLSNGDDPRAGFRAGSAVLSVLAAISAEWTKLRSARFTWLALGCSLLLMVGACTIIGLSVAASSANGYDLIASAPQTAAEAAIFAQLPLVIAAVVAVTGEYSTGAIRLTLRATPLRGQVLLAKSVLAAAFGCLAGVVLTLAGMAVATVALGEAASAATLENVVWTAAGTGASLALVSVVAVGIGTLLRSTLVSILALSFLLLAAPTLTELGTGGWLATVRDYLPSTAGELLSSPGADGYGPGLAALVLIAWVLVAQLLAYAALWLRDA